MGARDEFQAAAAAATRDYPFSQQDFERVRRLIYERAGISLNDSKSNMVYSRLTRRLRALDCPDFATYLERLERDSAFSAAEGQEFINALTTNLTSFYREAHHFPVLAEFAAKQAGPVNLWCAAASTGEEPYTIAITLAEANRGTPRILATDIDTQVLATAQRGVYRAEGAAPCGEARLRRHFLRGTGANAGMVRVRPELARLIEFAPLNLLGADWKVVERAAPFDAVFCRNVMIYFDKATQRKVLDRIAAVLRPGGLLFAGHSESLSDSRGAFVLRGKTVYERVAGK